MSQERQKTIQDELTLLILLADRVIKSAQEAESFKPENLDLSGQVRHLYKLLGSAAHLTTSSTAIYDRPILRVAADVSKSLNQALSLTTKCRYARTNIFRHVLSITTATDFRKLYTALKSSIADMRWVLSIYNNHDHENGDVSLSLPPLACNDPILAWVWSCIAAVHMGQAEAAHKIAILASDNDRNKKIIVEENGIPPLLKLLEETNPDAQSAAANALYHLANDEEHIRRIVDALGVKVIAKALSQGTRMRLQGSLVKLVSRMAEIDSDVKEEFGREDVPRMVVSILRMDIDLEDFKETQTHKTDSNLHPLVENLETRQEMAKYVGFASSSGCGNSSSGSSNRKEREREKEPVEEKLKIRNCCAESLWKLAKGSLSNSVKITETKALLVLAKIIQKEKGELQANSLMVVMELAAMAESDYDLRHTTFKPSSIPARAILDQLLRVINEDDTSPSLLILAIRTIGCLARIFPVKETWVVKTLVARLGNRDYDVAGEAATALVKFVCEGNYNRKENSRAIIEFGGVPELMRLVKTNGYYNRVDGHVDKLVLLCYLAINVGDSKALEQEHALSDLERAAQRVVSLHPDLKDLLVQAITQLRLYQVGVHVYIQP